MAEANRNRSRADDAGNIHPRRQALPRPYHLRLLKRSSSRNADGMLTFLFFQRFESTDYNSVIKILELLNLVESEFNENVLKVKVEVME